MKTLALFVLPALLLIACRPEISPGEGSEDFAAFLDQRVPVLLERYRVPGAVVGIIGPDEPTVFRAYGLADLAARRPMAVDTVFRAESISKSATVRGVMRLVEEGELDLDRPVDSLFRKWSFPPSEYDTASITTGDILSNSAGLPLGTIGPAVEYAPGEVLPQLESFLTAEAVAIANPGESFIYSDAGYNLLQLLVEDILAEEEDGARTFDAYMEQAVLAPLGMDDSSFAWREEYIDRIATAYESDGTPVAPYQYAAMPSGGLFSTLPDLCRFVAAGSLAGETEPAGVLTRESLKAIYRPRVEIPGLFGFVADSYGYGHFIETLPDGSRAVWHGGQGHGWMTHFHLLPETGEGIVILTNSQRSWPLLAELLTAWGEWTGHGAPGFGVILPATRILWGAILLLYGSAFILLVRSVGELRSGGRIAALRSSDRRDRTRRLLQAAGGAALIALVAWRASLPYVFETSIFPTAIPWLAGALLTLGAVLLIGGTVAAATRDQTS